MDSIFILSFCCCSSTGMFWFSKSWTFLASFIVGFWMLEESFAQKSYQNFQGSDLISFNRRTSTLIFHLTLL